ncbi:DUF4242 domain-containing protein (plasmid) [Kovacikia minuta CCNUW1]|uniref:DUF4242 domain-containing protein n=1 Tax=Kovacikia minuta TaxID=2931930 RepID=UPI001CCABDD0|nr:DUF4242 domain-containing protein [Kovacikia minuta]UBF30605.1 DUF4242 domain-containing protein [Kovacikia minuta CCNUW1]
MVLYLIEGELQQFQPEQIQQSLEQIAAQATQHQSELLEAQVGEDLQRLFVIIDAPNQAIAQQSFAAGKLSTAALLKEVRLVGQDLAAVRSRKGKANYLVEWNLPAGLTMEAYLHRKAEKSPLYAQVPAVQFERTYVCEDLSKCLCFYDSPDETTVKQARQVVGAPIDTLTPIRNVL